MKAAEIKVGGEYYAKISGVIVQVRVDAIRDVRRTTTRASYTGMRQTVTRQAYDVTNLKTGRRTTFRSAAKFRGPATTDEQQ